MTSLDIGLIVGFSIVYGVVITIELINLGLFTPLAIYERFKNRWATSQPESIEESTPLGVSVIVPAYNEEATIIDTVRALRAQEYQEVQIIVVNDASRDHTLEVLKETFDLIPADIEPSGRLSRTPVYGVFSSQRFPELIVIDKQRSGKGKADALNVGIGYAQHELICTVDADSILDPDALHLITEPFRRNPDQVVSGGTVRVGNGSRLQDLTTRAPRFSWNPLVLFQSLEYFKMSYIDRVVLSTFNGIYLVAGAFGVFRKSVVQELGGYRHDNLAEDLELTLRIHRHFIERGERYRISHVPNAVCWTEAPYNWSQLLRQRIRWQGGFVKTIFENRDMIFNRKYGLLGCLILPIHALMIGEIFFLLIAIGGIVIASQNYPIESVLLAALIAHCIANLIYVASVFVGESHLKGHHHQGHRHLQSVGRLVIWFFFGRLYDLTCLGFRLMGTFSQLRGELVWGEMKRAGFRRS